MLRIELDPADQTGLLRVLSILARRRCVVVRAAFAPDERTDANLLQIELDAPLDLGSNVMAWLAALLPVRSVERTARSHQPDTPAATAAA